MNRKEAKTLGLKTYNTGKPCKNGHLSDRYTSTAICIECVIIKGKKRREENPQYNYLAWRKWLEKNRDVHAVRVKRWQNKNKEKTRVNQKIWRKNNPEKVRAIASRWRKNNPDVYTARSVRSVINRSKRIPKWLTCEDNWLIKEFYHLARLRTKLTGAVWEVDHVIPLRGERISGLHVPSNLQVILKQENRAKRNFFTP